jgi:outer membrane protein assembly factor BamE (lipoprotein component of BamABCDE complex)
MAVITFYPDKPQNMDWEDREQYNQVQISKLELGFQKKQILELLGSPDITEAKRNDNKELQVMFYRTQHKKADGITTIDECTPLLFENNELIAWGDSAYQSYVDG